LETKSRLEKALLGYSEESKLANEEKLKQETLITKLEQAREEICSKHAATRKELKKILLSISLTLNPIKPEKPIKCDSTRGVKAEAPIEIEVSETKKSLYTKKIVTRCEICVN
jgi:hypothetical protein